MCPPRPDLPRLTRAVDDASPRRFLEVSGQRAALLGDERGLFEGWIWPLKLFHDLHLVVRKPEAEFAGPEHAREASFAPDETSIEYAAPDGSWTVRMTGFAALERRAIVLLFEVECGEPLELELRLRPDFRPQWPAGLGGQIAGRDPGTGAFLLTEELGRFAALIGSPEAEPVEAAGDHALPRDPVAITIPVSPARAAQGPIPFFIVGAQTEPEPLSAAARLGGAGAARGESRSAAVVELARALYRETASTWPDLREELALHWRDFLEHTSALSSSDPRLDEAFLWAKIAIEKAWVDVDGVGSGLVAGLGPSGSGERPGFGWLFDGDALVASRAMTGYGDWEGARRIFELASERQRDDGKLMHELVLSAGLCDWLGEYPYAYYKGGNTPGFIACLEHYLWSSDDENALRWAWPHVLRAFRHGVACLDDDGLISNRAAGLAAVEAGPLVGRLHSEVFLQGIWLCACRAVKRMAEVLGEGAVAEEAAAHEESGREAFERFHSRERGRYGFGLLGDPTDEDRELELQSDLTAYLAHPLSRGLGHPTHALASAAALNHPALASDWGARMFAVDSEVYDPADYNTGSVFPYLNNFVVLASYRQGLLASAEQLRASLLSLHGFSGLGFVPEHLVGDRAVAPARGVPHQIFSSAAIVQSTLYGMLGLRSAAFERTLVVRSALPPRLGEVRLERFRVGRSQLDLRFTRAPTSRGGRTRLALQVERLHGPSVRLFFRPWLPLLTRLVTFAVDGELLEDVELVPIAAALRPKTLAVEVTGPTRLVLEAELGPELDLRPSPLTAGRASRDPRSTEVTGDGESVTWTLWGLAGTSAPIPWRSDVPLDVSESPDEVEFPAEAAGPHGFSSTRLTLRATP